ncbi:hypothetical protein TSUD_38360 [Trifolium subterraneum]|uniref:Uncharacterized protein n=1 Tax=Trifolium subterraneum TaxID=3900 RepID=A0A2Z6NIX9_TRISU|nr:hypothetical protein TSUD_38360 [Trifolium subterraneum]
MCGGAIIADFIPRRGGRRLTAAELWPNSFGQQIDSSSSDFDFSHTVDQQQPPPITLKRSLPPKEAGYSVIEFNEGSNPNETGYFGGVVNEHEKEKEKVQESQHAVEADEAAKNEVQELSDELMAYEDYMKFYQIPYYDGQSMPPNIVQEHVVGDLWSFD